MATIFPLGQNVATYRVTLLQKRATSTCHLIRSVLLKVQMCLFASISLSFSVDDKKYFKTSDEVQVLVVAVALRFPGTRIWEAPQNTSQNSNFCLASAQDELDYNNCGNKHNKNMSETLFSVSIWYQLTTSCRRLEVGRVLKHRICKWVSSFSFLKKVNENNKKYFSSQMSVSRKTSFVKSCRI